MAKLCREDGCPNDKAPGRKQCYPHYGKRRRTEELERKYPEGMKLLFLDIETRPTIAYTWGLFKANIGINQIVEPGDMFCFAAKWHGREEPIEFYSDWQHGHTDMVLEAWRLLDEADAVVHYYGSAFDIKHMNACFLREGFPPPSPFKQVDLKLVVSKQFRFPSNKLQFVSEVLGFDGKEEHEGFPLWAKVLNAGDKYTREVEEDAKARMQTYNERDVILLEECYEVLLPWIHTNPNRHLYETGRGCPTCGAAANFIQDAGWYYTNLSKFAQFRCHVCSSYFRSNKREVGVKVQASML